MPTFHSLHILSKCFKLCKEVKLEFAKVAMKPVGPPVCVVVFHLNTRTLNLILDNETTLHLSSEGSQWTGQRTVEAVLPVLIFSSSQWGRSISVSKCQPHRTGRWSQTYSPIQICPWHQKIFIQCLFTSPPVRWYKPLEGVPDHHEEKRLRSKFVDVFSWWTEHGSCLQEILVVVFAIQPLSLTSWMLLSGTFFPASFKKILFQEVEAALWSQQYNREKGIRCMRIQ